MKKVTKYEYLKAQRTIATYEKQMRVGKYQFLYWLDGETDNDEKVKEKLVQARDIDEACNKFLLIKSSDVSKVDYEVAFEGEFIDISDKKGFENLI